MWQKPKTNWLADDYINVEDYNRIIGNLTYIYGQAKKLYPAVSYKQPSEKSIDQFPYASEFDYIEEMLDSLETNTYPFSDFVRAYWIDNGPTPNNEDLNRIESACLSFYNGYSRQKKQKISITLGRNQNSVKC